MKNNKALKIILIIAIVIVVILGIIGCTMLIEYQSDGEGTGETVTVEIEQGEGAWDIAGKLKEQGLIKYKSVFFLKAKIMGADGKLRFGTFLLKKGTGLENLIDDLIHGGAQKESVMFTVPEGYTIELIADKLEKESICSESEFLEAVEKEYDYWFLDTIPVDADVKYRLQGFLYPETYSISVDMTAEDIVKVMLDEFGKRFTSEMKDKADALGKSVYEVVIEASIIERETLIDAERVTVAGVIKNRLEINKPLEMCPTALYPVTDGIYDKTTVTYEDTKVDSPYNTYMYKGLPVGPIASPRIESLVAALNPEEHDYLYYHTDNVKKDGSHIFTKTYQEHTNTQ